jgi:hypothetical protein
MAVIQIKRRTTTGTGPLIGSSGTIKAGEPLIDLNGENLYVSRTDKTGSVGNPLAIGDYIEYLSKENTDSLVDEKITALALGTASKRNTGTSNGNVPLIGADGKLPTSIIPNISPVTSVNSKTGAVTITLSELGGVSQTSYNSHVASNLHLTDDQRTRIANVLNVSISQGVGAKYNTTKSGFDSSVLVDGLVLYNSIDTIYTPNKQIYHVGIDKTKVLTPSSIIDGGTY